MQPPSVSAPAPVLVGSGPHRYRWVPAWARLPAGMALGGTHGGVVVDRQGRIHVATEGRHGVVVFDQGGEVVGTWGGAFAGKPHGLAIAPGPDGAERVWMTHLERHAVLRFALDGTPERELPFPRGCPAYAQPSDYAPTGIAVAPDGAVYVGDGYGKGWVHQYAPDGTWLRAWDGSAGRSGVFTQPHGIGIDDRQPVPEVVVCDRGNSRLQRFALDGTWLGEVQGFRRPCTVAFHRDLAVVPDLCGRVTLLDRDWQVLAQLGDNPDEAERAQYRLEPQRWRDGVFIAPHGAGIDAAGALYVQDWSSTGRLTRLVPAP